MWSSHSLLEKGLVTKTARGNMQYFAPLDPKQLVSYLEHKEQRIESNKERVQAMLGEFAAIANPLTERPKIQFFDGPEGARTVLEDTLTAKESTLCAFLSIADMIEFTGAEFMDTYTDARIKKGYTLHTIGTREKDKEAFRLDPRTKRHKTSKKERRQVRHASEDLAFPMTMFLYDDKLAIISSKEEDFALIVESRELAQMQKKLFDMIWKSLERNTIRVGILHSLSGTMAISETSLVDATLMAIDEVNENGGVLRQTDRAYRGRWGI